MAPAGTGGRVLSAQLLALSLRHHLAPEGCLAGLALEADWPASVRSDPQDGARPGH